MRITSMFAASISTPYFSRIPISATLIATFNGNSADKSSSATSNFTVTTSGTITSGITTSGANNNTALIVGGIVAAGAVAAYFLL